MDDFPSSASRYGAPDVVWTGRYRTSGEPRLVVDGDEKGVALPLRELPRRVTGRRVVTLDGADGTRVAWDDVAAIFALRDQDTERPMMVERAVAVVNGVPVYLFEAAELDWDPVRALDVLRAVHLDPDLRARLGSDRGVSLFTEDGART